MASSAAIFGYAGAELLLLVSDAQFSLVVALAHAVRRRAVRLWRPAQPVCRGARRQQSRRTGGGHGTALCPCLAGVSIYGGFFNAGLGVLLLAFLTLSGIANIHAANGLKLYISSMIALVAVVRFAVAGSIDWYHGSIALVGGHHRRLCRGALRDPHPRRRSSALW